VRAGDDARGTFVEGNVRLVVSLATKYQASGNPLVDLIQDGNLGLIRTIAKFDWRNPADRVGGDRLDLPSSCRGMDHQARRGGRHGRSR
jgi:hypothetical protein